MNLVERLILLLLGPVLVIGCLVQVSGCHTTPVQTHLERVEAGATSIQRNANDAQEHAEQITGAENAPHKKAIQSDLTQIVIDAQGIHFNTDNAKEADKEKQKQLDRYRNDWMVQAVVWAQRWATLFIWGGVGFGLLYVVALVLGFCNPLSKPYQLSQMLVRALPLANVIRWLQPQTATVPAVTTPVLPQGAQ